MQNQSPIAIVGFAYRAPGVGRKGLWEYLAEAKSAYSKAPADRFDQDAFHWPDSEKAGCCASMGGYFLPDDIFAFDAPFFNLKADEARAIDPPHRMMLECALEATERAGISLTELAGSNVGVFSAIGPSEYGQHMYEDLPNTTNWAATGTAQCMFANRLSYFFDLTGPSIALDAACASSSYALHMACQSLRAGECSAAFVGGTHLHLGLNVWIVLDTMGALSSEGKSLSYDKKGSGFGRGEGGGCLLIKRLEDAIRCGDPVHAVIRNTATGHSGRSDGITMPSQVAQEKLLWQVHNEIGLRPSDTPVVEGHGTGTKVGDPIEAGAFARVLGADKSPTDPLYLGSIKSNFGHLEGASGVIGIIKAILMLKHGCVLPNAEFEEMNPDIEGKEKLKVLQETIPWPPNAPRRVCVTNFGFGGSNAAIILEDAAGFTGKLTNGTKHLANGIIPNGVVHTNDTDKSLANQLFVLSAKSQSSLVSYSRAFTEYLDKAPESSGFMKNLSFTLGQRRTPYPFRVAAVADSLASLKTQLSTIKVRKVKDHTIAFAFTGQGAQYAQMALGLQHHKPFAAALQQVEMYLRNMHASWSLMEELSKPEKESRIHDAEISQPACTAVQLALVALLRSWGVTTIAVVGHSSGEIAAAYAAGLISFEAAMAIAYFRGQAVAKLTREHDQKGGMLALGVGFEAATALIKENEDGYVTVAAINSPASVTLSGDVSAIDNIQRLAEAQGLFFRRLNVKVAYHSVHMEKVAAWYQASIEPYCLRSSAATESEVLFVSSVTGQAQGAETVDAEYWVKNLLQPVRFAEAIQRIFTLPADTDGADRSSMKLPDLIVEIGPHAALKNPIKQSVETIRQRGTQRQAQFTYLASLVRNERSDEAILQLAGHLFCLGVPIQLGTVNQTSHYHAEVVTDLPLYAWDKSTRFVFESRLSKEKLHPSVPFDPLLGWKSPHSTGGEHVFRQVFTLDQIPWLRDHNVAGEIVFPMTGYLSMAIEAARRITNVEPGSITIREFHAKRSLEIEEDDRVDITTKLRPAPTGSGNFSSITWAFEILTWTSSEEWLAHCHGLIETDETDLTGESPTFKAALPLTLLQGMEEADPKAEYEKAEQKEGGTIFGSAFKTVVRAWTASRHAVLENRLRHLDLLVPCRYGSPVTVDPPTLDSFLHGMSAWQKMDGKLFAHMPTYISRMRISNRIPAEKDQLFTIVSRLLSQDVKSGTLKCAVAVYAQCSGSLVPIAEWDTLVFKSIGLQEDKDPSKVIPSSYRWDLVPSLDFMSNESIEKSILVEPFDNAHLDVQNYLEGAALYYMSRALKETSEDDTSKLPPHLSKFLGWAKNFVARKKPVSDAEASFVLSGAAMKSAQGELLCAIGEELVPILRGEVQPLEIMLKNDLLSRNYEENVINAYMSRVLARKVAQLIDIKADLRILEIGGGTGSATLPVLEELSRGGDSLPPFTSYTFTDISAGFFENARAKFSKWSSRMVYKKLDISQDPVKQGFVTEDYDVVIASNVLHATANMAVTIGHVRSLLRPHGRLLLLEATSHAALTLPFALLPGWWYAEDKYRSHGEGPLLSEEGWDQLLRAEGFSGVDSAISPSAARENMLLVMETMRVGKPDTKSDKAPIIVCVPFDDPAEVEYARLVSGHISKRLGCPSSVKLLADIDKVEDSFCIFIDSARQTILQDLSSHHFDVLQTTLLESLGVLWIIPEKYSPNAQMIKGLLRTLRLENETKTMLLLENVPTTFDTIPTISNLAKRLQDPEAAFALDSDFVWHDDMVHLPRFRQLPEAKESFASEAGLPIRKLQSIGKIEEGLELTVDGAGSISNVYFRRTDVLSRDVGEDEIIVRVETSGMSRHDLHLILGSIPWTTPGFEGTGIVLRAGSHVDALQPGDRVFYALPEGGSYATHVRMPTRNACKIPDVLSSEDATTIFIAYFTAVMCIIRIGQLRKEETILIHNAAGPIGQACVVLAQHVKARVFATAGSQEERDFLHESFGLAKEALFSSSTTEFKEKILTATSGEGVNVIVNSLTGTLLQETWSLIAHYGRFIEIGKKDIIDDAYLPMKYFQNNVSFNALDMEGFFSKRPEELKECTAEISELLRQKIITPIRPISQFSLTELATGLRQLQLGRDLGKIVVTVSPEDTVMAETRSSLRDVPKQFLRLDATYLITGGTGGIGLDLAAWMIEHGAHNVVLLGRSGTSRPKVQELLAKHEGTEICVRALACDVGQKEELSNSLKEIEDLPPIRGIVHGALYLRDALLGNATFQDWQDITRPRVQGAWNLHELIPDAEFFINLSSFLGSVGNIGQSIYAGTATFFDAFSAYREAQGLRTISIAVPLVLDVGYVVDRGLLDELKDTLRNTLTGSHIRTLVKGAIIGPSSGLYHDGKAISFCYSKGDDSVILPWQSFHPLRMVGIIEDEQRRVEAITGRQGDAKGSGLNLAGSSDPLLTFLDALITKVSVMTMIDRDEVDPDAPLSDYSLDSLVSVELRNWIRRETGVRLPLPKIVGAANLRAMATYIISQIDGGTST